MMIMLQPYQQVPPNYFYRSSLRALFLCQLTVLVSLIVAVLTWSIFLHYSYDHQWQNPSKCTRQTDLWVLKYSTSANVSFARNVTSVNIDVLGLSIDRLIQASSHSTVVFRADLTWEKFDSKMIKTIGQREESIQGQLDIELLFQYPEQCCGNENCEEVFRYRIFRGFSKYPFHHLTIQSTDAMNTVLKVYLKKMISDNHGVSLKR